MRNIFLALVLANFAFAAWHAWFSGSLAGRSADPSADRRVAQSTLPESESIQLVGENDEALQARPRIRAPEPTPRPEPTPTPAADLPGTEVSPSIAMPALEPGSASSQGGGPSEAAPDDNATAENPAGVDEAVADGDVQANLRRCVSVGPFQDDAAATAAMEALRIAGHLASPRDAEGAAVVDYWVHLAEVPRGAGADEILARLRENGVDDAYLIPGEEDGDVISLGVFRQTSRAGRLQDEVRQIGYEPVVAELTRLPAVRWIDVALEPGGRLNVENLQTPGRITRLEQQPCPSSGG